MKLKQLLAKTLACTLAVSLLPSGLPSTTAAAETSDAATAAAVPQPAYFWDFNSQANGSSEIISSGSVTGKKATLHGAAIQTSAITSEESVSSDKPIYKDTNSVLVLSGGTKGTSYVDLPSDLYSGVTADTGLTWSFWMKPDENIVSYSRLFSSVNGSMEFAFAPYASDAVWNLLFEEGSSAYRQIYTMEPSKGKWNYITVTISDSEVTFYTNGNKSASTCGKGDAALLKTMLGKLSGCTSHALGKTSASWNDKDCAVQLDDVAIYNTALTHRQVIALAQSYGFDPDEPSKPDEPQNASEGTYGTGKNKKTLTAVSELTAAQGANTIKIWKDDADSYYYSVSRNGKVVIECSALGLTTSAADLTTGLTLGAHSTKTGTEDYDILQGNSSHVTKNYTELSFDLTKENSKITIIFRVFEDGMAYRYEVDGDTADSTEKTDITKEASEFMIPDKGTIWTTNQSNTYEDKEYTKRAMLDQYDAATVYSTPILASLGEDSGNAWVLLSEANVYNEDEPYCGSIFETEADSKAMKMKFGKYLIEETDESKDKLKYDPHYEYISKVTMTDIFHTPWRAAIITDDLESLSNSSLITDLNPDPAEGRDFDWVEPGASVWSWWSTSYDAIQYTTMKDYVDFAANAGIKYCLVDYGWELWDDYRTQVAELVKYAEAKGVSILVWYGVNKFDQPHIFDLDSEEEIEKEFAWCEEVGIKGVKVDYINSVSQFANDIMHKLASIAAKHHLVLNYHGCINPSGESRTYPNILSNEAVRGMENYKWNNGASVASLLTIPYTRNVLGSMEFTPTAYKEQNSPATAGFMLANVIVYESAIQTYAHSGYNYPGYAGLSLLSDVPTVWDESRLIDGYPGTHVIRARRNGENWYLGAMTLEGKTYNVPLNFLDPDKTYHAYIYKDNSDGTNIEIETKDVTAADTLPLALLANGGCSVKFSETEPLTTTIYDNFNYYEAEDGSHAVLSGEANVANNQFASNLKCVGYVGGKAANTLTFRDIPAEQEGDYTLNVYFITGAARDLYIKVNNGEPLKLEGLIGNAEDWKAVASTSVTVKLQAGMNEICLYNDSAYAPDIDRISVSKMSLEEIQKVQAAKATLTEAVQTVRDKISALKETDYTSESWKNLQNAIIKAEHTLKNATAAAADVTSAKDALETAYNSLKKADTTTKPNDKEEQAKKELEQAKTALTTGIQTVRTNISSLKEADYTPASWKALQDAIAKAEAALKNANTSAADITAAKTALDTAYSNLQKISEDTVKVSKIKFAAKSYKIAAGKKVTLKAAVSPSGASKTALSYSSSNKKYATVSSKGIVTTKKAGAGKTVTITAKAKDGSGKSAAVKIKIMKQAVKKISLSAKSKTLKAGKKLTIKAKVTPTGKGSFNKILEWTSSKPKYATVNKKGVVTAKKAGIGKSVTITATATDGSGKKKTFKIKIQK